MHSTRCCGRVTRTLAYQSPSRWSAQPRRTRTRSSPRRSSLCVQVLSPGACKTSSNKPQSNYEPIVDQLLRSGSQDAGQIEHTLDGLLDVLRPRAGAPDVQATLPALLGYRSCGDSRQCQRVPRPTGQRRDPRAWRAGVIAALGGGAARRCPSRQSRLS